MDLLESPALPIPAPPASPDASASYRQSSRERLSPHDLPHFQGATLFDRIARVVCEASCLPRKELYESWEVARRTRRRFRGGRVVDLACGHGLIAHMMILLDDTTATALAVDRRLPRSAGILAEAMVRGWPRLAGRITLAEQPVAGVAVDSGDSVVVLPCCQAEGKGDLGGVGGWVDGALAIDVTRAARLRAAGYAVYTQTIPAEITPKNRLLLGAPPPR